MIEQGKSVFLSETDGRQVVVVSPATQGWNTFFTGAGDLIVDGIIQRGNGTKIHLEWDDVESRGLKIIEFSFAEPVEIHDGQAFYTPTSNWKTSDIINFYIKIPANNPITNLNNNGNCIIVPAGDFNIIIPSTTGTHDIDLVSAFPVETEGGFWDVDYDTGVISPNSNGNGKFHLLTSEIKSFFMRNIPMGHPLGVLDVDTYKSEWVHQNWKIYIEITKNSPNNGEFAAWLLTFRKNTF